MQRENKRVLAAILLLIFVFCLGQLLWGLQTTDPGSKTDCGYALILAPADPDRWHQWRPQYNTQVTFVDTI